MNMYVDIPGTDEERTVAEVVSYFDAPHGTTYTAQTDSTGRTVYVEVLPTPLVPYVECEMADGTRLFTALCLLKIG